MYDPLTGLVRFGARDYDAAAGRWTAKDPIGFAGRSTNLYQYVYDAPIENKDPAGLEVIVIGDRRLYARAVIYLRRDPTLAAMIRRLEDPDGPTYTIVLNNSDDDRYDPATRTIFWDPFSALQCYSARRATQSPALGFAHEMAHADASWWQRLVGDRGVYGYDNAEEQRVIQGLESAAARALGEDVRYTHRGIPFKVPTPTSR